MFKSQAERGGMAKNKGGRPPKITKDVLNKLEEAFAIGASDEEACFYADISHQTLYNYQNKHPMYVERKEALKQRPILAARRSVVSNLQSDPDLAFRFLERKRRKEFAPQTQFANADGETFKIEIINYGEDTDTSQLRSRKKTLPTGNPKEQSEVQVSAYPS